MIYDTTTSEIVNVYLVFFVFIDNRKLEGTTAGQCLVLQWSIIESRYRDNEETDDDRDQVKIGFHGDASTTVLES